MAFAAPVFAKLTNVQHYVLIFCTKFYVHQTKNVQNTGMIFMKVTIAQCGIKWRSSVLTVIQICQEMWKLQVGIPLCP